MKRISRSSAVFYKRAMPLLWAVFMLMITVSLAGDIVRGNSHVSFVDLLPFWAIGAFAYVVNWLLTYGLADEVWEAGDHLVVRTGAMSVRLPIADIESVSEFPFSRPRRITLQLERPGLLGCAVVFLPFDGSFQSRSGRAVSPMI
jgi:hypothetical protein